MQRIALLAAAACLIGCVSGCGKSTASTAPYPLPSKSTPSTKPLPPEYRTLAAQLGGDLKSSPDQFRDDKGTSEIIAEGHSSVLALRGIKSPDHEITYIADQGQAAFAEALLRIERINALPKPPDVGTLFVSSFIDGFFGNVYGGYARGVEAEDQQKAIIAELHPLIAAIEKGDAAQLMLPKVAEKYSASLCDSTGRIMVGFDESWGWYGPHDWLSVCNNGPALEDCTILVQLTGANGQVRKNVHFVQNWPARSWMYARYKAGDTVLEKQVGRMTVNEVKQIDVTIYSPNFATASRYIYDGAERDKDVAERCKSIQFTGRYQPFVSGILWNDERGAYFTMNGVASIPKCRVDVTFRKSGQSKSWYWPLDSWTQGESKSFITPAGGLTFDPDSIDMVVSFPGTTYKHDVTLTVKN